jgi:hypothetical protein
MVKRNRIYVSANFSEYLKGLQANLRNANGREYSTTELTEILSQFRPTITLEQKKKRKTIFDF